ncbi:MAG: GIY-YIG nuclease family protein [Bacteroidales bacterium]|nr:GIY-YIG nuclease family protein [Bacteroidales bacterium]
MDKYYIGHSSDIVDRVRKHNTNHKGFTGQTNDWTAVYFEEYTTKSKAYARERQVKKWKNRKRLEQLIAKVQSIPTYKSGGS